MHGGSRVTLQDFFAKNTSSNIVIDNGELILDNYTCLLNQGQSLFGACLNMNNSTISMKNSIFESNIGYIGGAIYTANMKPIEPSGTFINCLLVF